jgi:hypothetical protein
MDPAPGFDPLMPHDMLHFLVEQELGLRKGIFGQIAIGGTAGTFHQMPSANSSNRADSRSRRKNASRGKKLLKENSDDCVQSERATYICLYDWLSHSSEAKLQARAKEMKITYDTILTQMSAAESARLNEKKLAEIRIKMDELSNRWSALQINQSMRLKWEL